MANVDRVNGFKPVGHIHGAGYSGETQEYSVDSGYAQALFVGDPLECRSIRGIIQHQHKV